jgi:hypothetical protein
VEMGRGNRGAKVSLPSYASPGSESKHYFNATVVSNACVTGVAGERGGRSKWNYGKGGAEAERVQVIPPSCASPIKMDIGTRHPFAWYRPDLPGTRQAVPGIQL